MKQENELGRKAIENRIRTAAAFAECGADLESGDKNHAEMLFSGARLILDNAPAMAAALRPLPTTITFTLAELLALEAMADNSSGDDQDLDGVLERSQRKPFFSAMDKLRTAINGGRKSMRCSRGIEV